MPAKKLQQCQIIGAGPAGMGLIIALFNQITNSAGERNRRLMRLLDSLTVIEAGSAPGGVLGSYQINANTHATDAVAAIDDGTPLVELRDRYLKMPEIEQLLISLPCLQELFVKSLSVEITGLLGDRLITKLKVNRIALNNGMFTSYDENDAVISHSINLVTCCGGTEQLLPGLKPWLDKIAFGGEFLRLSDTLTLPRVDGPIVITSASHSGFSCVWRLRRVLSSRLLIMRR